MATSNQGSLVNKSLAQRNATASSSLNGGWVAQCHLSHRRGVVANKQIGAGGPSSGTSQEESRDDEGALLGVPPTSKKVILLDRGRRDPRIDALSQVKEYVAGPAQGSQYHIKILGPGEPPADESKALEIEAAYFVFAGWANWSHRRLQAIAISKKNGGHQIPTVTRSSPSRGRSSGA